MLALLDLDEFKVLNDAQGHQRGDEVLLTFADLLREARLSAAAFRLGGDDFALILSEAVLTDATLALERFREDVERSSLGITLSIGMAETTSEEFDRELLHTGRPSCAERRQDDHCLPTDLESGDGQPAGIGGIGTACCRLRFRRTPRNVQSR
jgi:hypothetical protein